MAWTPGENPAKSQHRFTATCGLPSDAPNCVACYRCCLHTPGSSATNSSLATQSRHSIGHQPDAVEVVPQTCQFSRYQLAGTPIAGRMEPARGTPSRDFPGRQACVGHHTWESSQTTPQVLGGVRGNVRPDPMLNLPLCGGLLYKAHCNQVGSRCPDRTELTACADSGRWLLGHQWAHSAGVPQDERCPPQIIVHSESLSRSQSTARTTQHWQQNGVVLQH